MKKDTVKYLVCLNRRIAAPNYSVHKTLKEAEHSLKMSGRDDLQIVKVIDKVDYKRYDDYWM